MATSRMFESNMSTFLYVPGPEDPASGPSDDEPLVRQRRAVAKCLATRQRRLHDGAVAELGADARHRFALERGEQVVARQAGGINRSENALGASVAVLVRQIEHEGDAALGPDARREQLQPRDRCLEGGDRRVDLHALERG